MPTLTAQKLRTLGAYALKRQHHVVPNTNAGGVYQAACWNWALTGGTVQPNNVNGAIAIYEAIVATQYDPLRDVTLPVAINNVDAQFAGCNAYFTALRNNLANALAGNAGAQNAFKVAMMSICAHMNGLGPNGAGDAGTYSLNMRTDTWWAWDHWGLGIRPTPGAAVMYVQTVPNCPVYHGCSTMWDEHLPLASIQLTQLLGSHVNVLNNVAFADVYEARCTVCGTTHGSMPSLFNHWHQCGTCGTVYCPTHGAALAGKLSWDRTRTCGRCGGRTRLV